jgi:hypothetical protein
VSTKEPQFDLKHPKGWENFRVAVDERIAAGKTAIVRFLQEHRTLSQNAMSFQLYAQIAKQSEDQGPEDVRRECKLIYGVPLMCAASPEYANYWFDTIYHLNHEQQLHCMKDWPVTSQMDKPTFSEYVDTILRTYTMLGYALADPRQASEKR